VDPYGGIAEWKEFVDGSLVFPFAKNQNATFVQLSTVESYEPNASIVTETCAGAEAFNIAKALIAAPSFDLQSFRCNGLTWRVKACMDVDQVEADAVVSMCTACNDPCLPHECDERNYVAPVLTASDTGAAGTCPRRAPDPRRASDGVYRVLAVGFVHPVPAPAIVAMSVVSLKTALTVSVDLESDGRVYCGVISPSATQPTDQSVIKAQSFVAGSVNASASVEITGLFPSTSYNVYCYSVSAENVDMSLASMLATLQTVSTACCKTVLVDILSPSVFVSSTTAEILSVSLDAPSSASLSVSVTTIFTVTASGFPSPHPNAFVPNAVTINAGSTAGRTLGYTAPNSVGIDSLIVALTPDDGTYQVVFGNNVSAVSVVAASTEMPAPVLSNAVFNSDGSAIGVSLNVATDRAGKASANFPCSTLFTFPGVESATCTWTSKSVVKAVLGGGATAVVGSSFQILEGKLRAECTSAATCGSWPATANTTVLVQAPVAPMTPVVVIAAPNVLGSCAFLTLDLSASTGSGGRGFTVSVVATHSGGNSSALNQFLTSQYTMSPPTAIPPGYFEPGTSYGFTVSLTNFLGATGQEFASVIILNEVMPTAFIPGSSFRTITRSDGLSLQASASVASGCNGLVTSQNLRYGWVISLDGVSLPAAQQSLLSSVQANAFVLQPYTLSVGNVYDIEVTVTYTVTGAVTAESVQVLVQPSVVDAIISGGSEVTVQLGNVLVLDGSLSIDDDISDETGAAAGLTFLWSCH